MGKTPSEVRHEQRKPVKVFINYRTIDQFFSEMGTNLSTGGVFVKSTNPLPVGTEIKISFNIPQFGCYLESIGVVVHNGTAENPGMGIKFKGLSERAKKLLQDVLEHELLPSGEDVSKQNQKSKGSKTRITLKVESRISSKSESVRSKKGANESGKGKKRTARKTKSKK